MGAAAGNRLGAEELSPLRIESSPVNGGKDAGQYSQRTLSLAFEVDRDHARLIAYTLKPYPYIRPITLSEPLPSRDDGFQTLEVVLLGSSGKRFTQRLEVGLLCFTHPGGTAPHIRGDQFTLHRDSFVIEAPEVVGFDRVEVARYDKQAAGLARKLLAEEKLDAARFTPAGGGAHYSDLAFAQLSPPIDPLPPVTTSGTVIWPESVGDPDVYRLVAGDASEGDKRVSIVIVPDGYRTSEKGLIDTHANALVNYLRGLTPYAEHSQFINYILVYAYSLDSGVDQCDCGILKDTAMGLYFPEVFQSCGAFENRCLNYGGHGGCDTNSSGNIALAEMRAPGFDSLLGDKTVIMGNTSRYGGCGGTRSVYAAGNSNSRQVAAHELGHSMAGLGDEYGGTPSCGPKVTNINTSKNELTGAWPEWIDDLGPPVLEGETFDNCIYHPSPDCYMRSLGLPFCPVCNQHWALVFFGEPRVAPTAPIASMSPASPRATITDTLNVFSVSTRLGGGASSVTWNLQGPGFPTPTVVDSGPVVHSQVFPSAGQYTLSCQLTADTNFVKPSKNGANMDVATWTVDVTFIPPSLPSEVSPPGASQPLVFADATTLIWEDASFNRAASFNLYRGDVSGLHTGNYGACLQPSITSMSSTDSAYPPLQTCWFYLVTGRNSVGEGSMGSDSAGVSRSNGAPCP